MSIIQDLRECLFGEDKSTKRGCTTPTLECLLDSILDGLDKCYTTDPAAPKNKKFCLIKSPGYELARQTRPIIKTRHYCKSCGHTSTESTACTILTLNNTPGWEKTDTIYKPTLSIQSMLNQAAHTVTEVKCGKCEVPTATDTVVYERPPKDLLLALPRLPEECSGNYVAHPVIPSLSITFLNQGYTLRSFACHVWRGTEGGHMWCTTHTDGALTKVDHLKKVQLTAPGESTFSQGLLYHYSCTPADPDTDSDFC